MQAKVVGHKPFTPFEVVITVETEEDLKALAAVANTPFILVDYFSLYDALKPVWRDTFDAAPFPKKLHLTLSKANFKQKDTYE
jgi:hypothetical protein